MDALNALAQTRDDGSRYWDAKAVAHAFGYPWLGFTIRMFQRLALAIPMHIQEGEGSSYELDPIALVLIISLMASGRNEEIAEMHERIPEMVRWAVREMVR